MDSQHTHTPNPANTKNNNFSNPVGRQNKAKNNNKAAVNREVSFGHIAIKITFLILCLLWFPSNRFSGHPNLAFV